MLFNASYVVSFAFPQSTTKTISFIVMLASAIFVARTIFRTLGGAFSKISFCQLNQLSLELYQYRVSERERERERERDLM